MIRTTNEHHRAESYPDVLISLRYRRRRRLRPGVPSLVLSAALNTG